MYELQFLTVFVFAMKILMDVHPLQIVLMSLCVIRLYIQNIVLRNLAESKFKQALW